MTVGETLSSWYHMVETLFWRNTPPPILGGVVSEDHPRIVAEKVDRLVNDVHELERELKRQRII